MEDFCRSQREALEELERVAPGAPFLALGQTVFWDEPLKAGVALASAKAGYQREFISGIHDTDYFAKHSDGEKNTGYSALPHNDTTTKAIWSAAGEFSALFGSETIVSREQLSKAGGKVARVATRRPGYLDGITEAWGWRGVVSYDKHLKTTADTPLRPLLDTLYETFDWSLNNSLESVAGPEKGTAESEAGRLRSLVCNVAANNELRTLADFFEALSPKMYQLVGGKDLQISTSRTTRLLQFNSSTCHLPRFQVLDLFLNPETREKACEAYDNAVSEGQMYTLDRFGPCAIPFDVYVPGKGRGTLNLGTRGGLIMTEEPLAFSFKKPIDSVARLAEVLEKKFGPDVVIIGKAVSLPAMLASEFAVVFHEGASSYIPLSRKLCEGLKEIEPSLSLNPILRVRYEPWDALFKCKSWIRLPEPLRGPFGVEELSAESFSKRWREVSDEQEKLLSRLSELKRPLDLIQFLAEYSGGHWSCLASEYQTIPESLADLNRRVDDYRVKRKTIIESQRSLKEQFNELEAERGRDWREKIFEKDASPEDLKKREHLIARIDDLRQQIAETKTQWADVLREQAELVGAEERVEAQRRRKDIAFEAELMRMKLVRSAVIATQGLRNAGYRPCAWWFDVLSPSGCWFKETMKRVYYYLEPLC